MIAREKNAYIYTSENILLNIRYLLQNICMQSPRCVIMPFKFVFAI